MSDILSKEEARSGIKKGIDKVAETVAITAGPKGKNVVIAQGFGASNITNDGVTVARSISLSDAVEDLGAHMVKEVATNTEEATGDGTTTATILFQALVEDGIKKLSSGADPNFLKVGMAKAANRIVENLDKMSLPVKDNDTIRKVATISANNDPILGELIAEAFHEAGDAGEVAVTDSGSFETFIKVVEGLRFDRGYLHRAFINNVQSMRAELEEPNIMVTDKKISSSKDLESILSQLDSSGNSKLLLISDDISPDVLMVLALSKVQGKIDVTCVKAPGFGDSRPEMLEDIACMTGATFIGPAHDIRETKLEDLGKADQVYVEKDETTIVGGKGETEEINKRIDNVKHQLENTPELEDYPKQILQKRLGYLKGGVSVLYIGAASDTELAEKKYRIEDAIGATRSAVAEGIVPGGGVALIRATSNLDDFNLATSEDEELGIKIVLNAINKPFAQILKNAGHSPEVVMARIKGESDFFGMDVKTGEFGDLMKLGVIDPVKVAKTALLNAVSVAGLMLTTEAVVFEKSE